MRKSKFRLVTACACSLLVNFALGNSRQRPKRLRPARLHECDCRQRCARDQIAGCRAKCARARHRDVRALRRSASEVPEEFPRAAPGDHGAIQQPGRKAHAVPAGQAAAGRSAGADSLSALQVGRDIRRSRYSSSRAHTWAPSPINRGWVRCGLFAARIKPQSTVSTTLDLGADARENQRKVLAGNIKFMDACLSKGTYIFRRHPAIRAGSKALSAEKYHLGCDYSGRALDEGAQGLEGDARSGLG